MQSLYFLNPKFQASNHLLYVCSPVCVRPGREPRRPVFSEFRISITVKFRSKQKHRLRISYLVCKKTQSIYPIFAGEDYSKTVIVFMTDGADTVNPKEMLPQMPSKLKDRWGEINKDVVIHSVGFTSGNYQYPLKHT